MPLSSRFNAARRVLTHFYWQRMRYQGRDIVLPRNLARISSLQLQDGTVHLAGWASQSLRLVSDQAMVEISPGDEGKFHTRLHGARYLSVSDIDHIGPTVTLPLSRLGSRISTLLRCLAELIRFPIVHRRDLRDYFIRGESEAGDRLERALLPSLAPVFAIPRGHIGTIAAHPSPINLNKSATVIILPVYNARELVRECLDNLDRNTSGPHKIVIIDDASPDPEVAPLLAAWAARHPQAKVLTNENNLGFVRTVNRGIALAKGRDVILLNSDAMVPPGWLARLIAPMQADPRIASVTPLSNDAEIFDAPVECRARVLAPGEAIGADRMAARLDPLEALVEAPTGVGFCMALSRRWLAKVPQLDTIFGRGYGEEVDWCQRTAALGARHVATGTLFVEHRSGSSFGDEKPARVEANNRIVSTRYPAYDLTVQQFREADPLAGPRLAVGLALLAAGAEQADPGSGFPVWLGHRWTGGAEHWLQDRIKARVAAGSGALVLRDASEEADAAKDALLAELHCAQGITRVILSGKDIDALLGAVPQPLEFSYSCLVGARAPLEITERITAILARRGRADDRFTVLFHDFLPLCPSYTLMGADRHYCGLPEKSACQSCYEALPVTSGRRPEKIGDWRARWHQIMVKSTCVRVFSEDSRAHVLKIWPDLADRITVTPHAIDHLPAPVAAGASATFTVGVLGAIGYNKGAEILQKLAANPGDKLRLVIIGIIDPAYAHSDMLIHGHYEREQISALAARYKLDGWLIPSIWPETFCYAVRECLATGLPVLGFDLGAQGESLRAAANGVTIPLGTTLSAALLRHELRCDR